MQAAAAAAAGRNESDLANAQFIKQLRRVCGGGAQGFPTESGIASPQMLDAPLRSLAAWVSKRDFPDTIVHSRVSLRDGLDTTRRNERSAQRAKRSRPACTAGNEMF